MSVKRTWALTALGALAIAGMALPAPALASRLPAGQYDDTVEYITGGIGKTEAHAFERALPQHALDIELLEHAGKYLEFTADAKVNIIDPRGHAVMSAVAEGPFMLVDLPPGRYTVLASLGNSTLRKSLAVNPHAKPVRATFEFPDHSN